MGMNSQKIMRAEHVFKSYAINSAQSLEVLKDVSIHIEGGKVVAIVGPSGAGKSTLLHILGGLDRPTSGHVYFEDSDLFALDDEDLASHRNHSMGFVFQFHHLLPEFTARENVALPSLIAGESRKNSLARATQLLKDIGLEHRLDHRPSELSGGEQQRVAVARALINEPRLILADEPSGNLDEKTGRHLHELLIEISRQRNVTIIVATHNVELASMADWLIRLTDGRVEADRRTNE